MSQGFRAVFGSRDPASPLLIGVVHLAALPGAPGHEGGMRPVLEAALADAAALEAGGMRGIIVENFGDAPFWKDRVPPETVAAMARSVSEIRRAVSLPLGVNVLRNDAGAALAVATACDAEFIRVNVHTGAMVTDQGIVEGRAAETLRLRRALGSRALILADVMVKHAAPLAVEDLIQSAEDTYERGQADALLVTGSGTGKAASPAEAARLREALPRATLLVASGVTGESVAEWLGLCDGAIVGTWVKRGGDVSQPVDAERVAQLVARAKGSTGRN